MNDTSLPNVEALRQQRDWLHVTLSSIGDAVITTALDGRVTFLNPVAECLTGWTQEAVGQPLDSLVRIINEDNRQPVEIPTVQALREDRTVKLASVRTRWQRSPASEIPMPASHGVAPNSLRGRLLASMRRTDSSIVTGDWAV